VQSQIFESTDVAGRQACVNCHTNVGRAPAGGLNLVHGVAYDQIVNVVSPRKPGAIRVIPGDAENSYLVQKLEGRAGIVGVRMPQSGPPFLTDGQILILRSWIELGAPRNYLNLRSRCATSIHSPSVSCSVGDAPVRARERATGRRRRSETG